MYSCCKKQQGPQQKVTIFLRRFVGETPALMKAGPQLISSQRKP